MSDEYVVIYRDAPDSPPVYYRSYGGWTNRLEEASRFSGDRASALCENLTLRGHGGHYTFRLVREAVKP